MSELMLGPLFGQGMSTANFEKVFEKTITNTQTAVNNPSSVTYIYTPEEDTDFVMILFGGGNFYTNPNYAGGTFNVYGTVSGNYTSYIDYTTSVLESRSGAQAYGLGYAPLHVIFGRFKKGESVSVTPHYANTGGHGLVGGAMIYIYKHDA